jgi:hypothetical protein
MSLHELAPMAMHLRPVWLTSKIFHAKDLTSQKLGKNIATDFGKLNARVWQVLVANQILAKIMACQIIGMTNFGNEPIRP